MAAWLGNGGSNSRPVKEFCLLLHIIPFAKVLNASR